MRLTLMLIRAWLPLTVFVTYQEDTLVCFYLHNLWWQDSTLCSHAYLLLMLALYTINASHAFQLCGYVVLCLGSIFSK